LGKKGANFQTFGGHRVLGKLELCEYLLLYPVRLGCTKKKGWSSEIQTPRYGGNEPKARTQSWGSQEIMVGDLNTATRKKRSKDACGTTTHVGPKPRIKMVTAGDTHATMRRERVKDPNPTMGVSTDHDWRHTQDLEGTHQRCDTTTHESNQELQWPETLTPR
jgi:hypothetical protein